IRHKAIPGAVPLPEALATQSTAAEDGLGKGRKKAGAGYPSKEASNRPATIARRIEATAPAWPSGFYAAPPPEQRAAMPCIKLATWLGRLRPKSQRWPGTTQAQHSLNPICETQ